MEARFAPTASVQVGQLAVAVGSPFDLTGTVTSGIVSSIRINLQGGSDPSTPVPVEMIQTDASHQPGELGWGPSRPPRPGDRHEHVHSDHWSHG